MSHTSGWLRRIGYKLLAHTDSERVDVNGSTLKDVLDNISTDIDNLQIDNIENQQNIERNAQGVEEAIAIAHQYNNALVFTDYAEMKVELSKEENKNKYPVGTNVYIIDLNVDDKWISAQLDQPNDEGLYYTLQNLESGTIQLEKYEIASNFLYRCLCNTLYSKLKTYELDSIVRYNYQLYRNINPVLVPEEWDPLKWKATDIASLVEVLLQSDVDKVLRGEIILDDAGVVDIADDIRHELLLLESKMANKTTTITQVSENVTRIVERDEAFSINSTTTITVDGNTTTLYKEVVPATGYYNYIYSSVTTKESDTVTNIVESYSSRLKN